MIEIHFSRKGLRVTAITYTGEGVGIKGTGFTKSGAEKNLRKALWV